MRVHFDSAVLSEEFYPETNAFKNIYSKIKFNAFISRFIEATKDNNLYFCSFKYK